MLVILMENHCIPSERPWLLRVWNEANHRIGNFCKIWRHPNGLVAIHDGKWTWTKLSYGQDTRFVVTVRIQTKWISLCFVGQCHRNILWYRQQDGLHCWLAACTVSWCIPKDCSTLEPINRVRRCIYISLYVYTYIHIYVIIYVILYTHTCIHVHVQTYTCIYTIHVGSGTSCPRPPCPTRRRSARDFRPIHATVPGWTSQDSSFPMGNILKKQHTATHIVVWKPRQQRFDSFIFIQWVLLTIQKPEGSPKVPKSLNPWGTLW